MTDLEYIQRRTLEQLRRFDRFCRTNGLKYFAAGGTLLGAVRHRGFIPWDDDADLLMLRDDYEKLRQLMRKNPPENCFLVSGEDEAANPHSHGRFCDAGEDIVSLEMPALKIDRHLGIDIFVLDGAPAGLLARLRHRWMNYLYVRLALLFAGGSSNRGRWLKKILKAILSPFLTLAEIKRRGQAWATRYPAGSTPLLVCVGGKYGYAKELFPVEMFAAAKPLEFSDMQLPAPALYDLYLRGHYGADYMRVPDPPPVDESHYMVLGNDAACDFSLIVATIDRTTELARFLASIRETDVTFEVIIADQNPDYRLNEVLAPFQGKLKIVHLARLPMCGQSAARNTALTRAGGRFIAFPDDDCVYPPGILGRVAAEFRRRPALAGVSGISVALENPADRVRLKPGCLTRNGLFFRGETFVHFFRRETVEKLGGFSLMYGIGGVGFQGGEDSEYLLRALDAGMTLWRDPEIRIGHPRGVGIANALRKSRMYGEARMALLRQYRFPLWVRLLHAIYPLWRIFSTPKFAWTMFSARIGALFITPPQDRSHDAPQVIISGDDRGESLVTKKLQILLATYNSEPFLSAQLDSILTQDTQDFEVLIRDGGSTDGTLALIERYCGEYPGRILFVGQGRAGACENFSELLKCADGDLLMFADHDDIWMKDKVSVTVAKYKELEQKYGSRTPILVFSDAVVADGEMNVVSDSLIEYQKLDPLHLTLDRLILQNVLSGNAMLLNRALAELVVPIPQEAVMHDHWIALAASAFGQIGFLDRPTLYYRQHADNVFGASPYSLFSFVRRLRCGRQKIRERFDRNIVQAAAFGRRYGDKLPARERELCNALSEWSQLGFWSRRRLLWKYRLRKTGFLRNLGMYLTV